MAFESIETQVTPVESLFGVMPNGDEVHEYVLSNSNGISVGILNYGGIIRYIKTPDRAGHISDIILGFDDLEAYLNDDNYMGAIIGRYANRIAGGSFKLDNLQVDLDQNEDGNCLHGGSRGLSHVVWTKNTDTNDISHLQLSHLSDDGDNGFPGNLLTTVSYTLTETNQLILDITAVSDKRTVVSITAHPYFNLGNDHTRDTTNHLTSIRSKKYLPIDQDSIPTGIVLDTANSVFDLFEEKVLSTVLSSRHDQLKLANGFDHCYVFVGDKSRINKMATLRDEVSGRVLRVSSNAPGLQFYTSNFLSKTVQGKRSIPFMKHGAVCLEPQHLPNAPNEAKFPSSILEAGANYHHKIVYEFDHS